MNYKYKLKFLPTALKEWKKLDSSIQNQLRKRLKERLQSSHITGSQLHGFENYFKIKLRASGYRLVYEEIEKEIVVLVIAVGKREKNFIYRKAAKRSRKS
jgi:mRNA interferase RelE/StbE